MFRLLFRGFNFCGLPVNCENWITRKFLAIRYMVSFPLAKSYGQSEKFKILLYTFLPVFLTGIVKVLERYGWIMYSALLIALCYQHVHIINMVTRIAATAWI